MKDFVFQVSVLLTIVWFIRLAVFGASTRVIHARTKSGEIEWDLWISVGLLALTLTQAHYRGWPVPWPF